MTKTILIYSVEFNLSSNVKIGSVKFSYITYQLKKSSCNLSSNQSDKKSSILCRLADIGHVASMVGANVTLGQSRASEHVVRLSLYNIGLRNPIGHESLTRVFTKILSNESTYQIWTLIYLNYKIVKLH